MASLQDSGMFLSTFRTSRRAFPIMFLKSFGSLKFGYLGLGQEWGIRIFLIYMDRVYIWSRLCAKIGFYSDYAHFRCPWKIGSLLGPSIFWTAKPYDWHILHSGFSILSKSISGYLLFSLPVHLSTVTKSSKWNMQLQLETQAPRKAKGCAQKY